MKRRYCGFSAIVLPLCGLFVIGCGKAKDTPVPIPPDASGIKCDETKVVNDTLTIDYNTTLDLSEIFSIEPDGGVGGELVYSILRQPDFVEGSDPETPYTTVDGAYTVTGGHTLTSVDGKRVPDPLSATPVRTRVVREGKLKVALKGATAEIASKEIVIVQTNKPALPAPTVRVVESSNFTDGPNGKLLTIETTGTFPRSFLGGSFTISPIDYDPDKIVVRPQPNSTYIYAPGTLIGSYTAQATCAGGVDGAAGTGEYIIGFYCENPGSSSSVQAAYDAVKNLPPSADNVARLYVNVTLVAATEVVGIVLWDGIGTTNATSFYRNSQLLSTNFIRMKLNNGTTREYSGATDGNIIAGEFTSSAGDYLIGTAGSVNAVYPEWHGNVILTADPRQEANAAMVGVKVGFTITHQSHFKDADWTVKVVDRPILSAAPVQ